MKNKIFKFIILPIIISLIAYIAIAIISVDFISLKSVHGYSIEKETLHNIRVMKYYFITLPLMSIIPSVIYYAIIFLRKIMDRMNIQSNKDDHISNDISIIKSEINNIKLYTFNQRKGGYDIRLILKSFKVRFKVLS
mgnify:CR=1 FL=1